MSWIATFTSNAAKSVKRLPKREKDLLALLVRDLELRGPVVPD